MNGWSRTNERLRKLGIAAVSKGPVETWKNGACFMLGLDLTNSTVC